MFRDRSFFIDPNKWKTHGAKSKLNGVGGEKFYLNFVITFIFCELHGVLCYRASVRYLRLIVHANELWLLFSISVMFCNMRRLLLVSLCTWIQCKQYIHSRKIQWSWLFQLKVGSVLVKLSHTTTFRVGGWSGEIAINPLWLCNI